MEVKRNVLILIVDNDKVLLCKRKDGQFWGGLIADIPSVDSEETAIETQKYIKEKFGVVPKSFFPKGLVTKKIFDGDKEPDCTMTQIIVAEKFDGTPQNDEYEFEWVGVYQLMTKPLESGDYYWLGMVARGSNMNVWLGYDTANNLLTFKSEPKIANFSYKGDGK